ncbi:MAG: NAD-dependent epimerase/dehydratase family protein [Bryobacterales bacterium]|nr:NAD-dependent epimerase/dehydratase family protein [Bryobacterales bacterium]
MDKQPGRIVKSAFVTGATGFVGLHLIDSLLNRNVQVRALTRDIARCNQLRDRGVELVCGDLSEPQVFENCLQGIDTVFHTAAIMGPPTLPWELFRSVNADGTRSLMRDAVRAGVARFVHVSTVAVTGGSSDGRPVSEDGKLDPRGRYALSKLEAEQIVKEEGDGRLGWVIARPTWVYGARSPSTVKLFGLIAQRRMVLIGNAANENQPIAVDDLIEALLQCGTCAGVESRTYHLAGPRPIRTSDMCASIARAMGVAAPHIRIPMALARMAAAVCETCLPVSMRKLPIDSQKLEFFRARHTYSLERAAAELAWRPATEFEPGARALAAELAVRSARQ